MAPTFYWHLLSLSFLGLFDLFDPDTLQFLDPAMLNTYFQQAVSDTAMDIQEAENGIETSKLTDHTYENVNIFSQKKRLQRRYEKYAFFFPGHPETTAASAPAPPAAEVFRISPFFLVLQNSHFLKMGENILPAHNLVVDMFVH